MKKVLVVASLAPGRGAEFHPPIIQTLREKGVWVDVAPKGALKNIFALRRALREKNYGAVYCPTGAGALAVRLACLGQKNRPHIFCLARGSRLCRGAAADPKESPKAADRENRASVRKELKIPPETFVMICADEPGDNKSRIQLLEMLRILLKSNPNALLLLAGKDPGRGKIRRAARRLGVAENVRFLGKRDDLPRILAECDAGIAAARHEGSDRTVLRYMAASLPVVAFDSRGRRESIKNGETGFLVPRGDAPKMAEKLILLRQNRVLREELTAAARRPDPKTDPRPNR